VLGRRRAAGILCGGGGSSQRRRQRRRLLVLRFCVEEMETECWWDFDWAPKAEWAMKANGPVLDVDRKQITFWVGRLRTPGPKVLLCLKRERIILPIKVTEFGLIQKELWNLNGSLGFQKYKFGH
jgi:hypothetical protein